MFPKPLPFQNDDDLPQAVAPAVVHHHGFVSMQYLGAHTHLYIRGGVRGVMLMGGIQPAIACSSPVCSQWAAWDLDTSEKARFVACEWTNTRLIFVGSPVRVCSSHKPALMAMAWEGGGAWRALRGAGWEGTAQPPRGFRARVGSREPR